MARKLAHDDGESRREDNGDEGLLLERRRYMKLGGAAVAALAGGSLGATAQSSGTVYWTEFSEGQL